MSDLVESPYSWMAEALRAQRDRAGRRAAAVERVDAMLAGAAFRGEAGRRAVAAYMAARSVTSNGDGPPAAACGCGVPGCTAYPPGDDTERASRVDELVALGYSRRTARLAMTNEGGDRQ